MKSILVPVDFSEVTRATLQVAQALAVGFGAKVYLIHVDQLDADDLEDSGLLFSRRELIARLAAANHERLRQLARNLGERGCHVEVLLVQGDTVEKILDEARRLGADLIVMGAHGHGRLYNVVVGSVCQRVLRRSEVPVLVVPARAMQRERDDAVWEHAECRRA